MIKEHEQVVLRTDVPEEGLKAGDVGTVVHIHETGEAFEVEFATVAGETVTIVTLVASQVRSVPHMPGISLFRKNRPARAQEESQGNGDKGMKKGE